MPRFHIQIKTLGRIGSICSLLKYKISLEAKFERIQAKLRKIKKRPNKGSKCANYAESYYGLNVTTHNTEIRLKRNLLFFIRVISFSSRDKTLQIVKFNLHVSRKILKGQQSKICNCCGII